MAEQVAQLAPVIGGVLNLVAAGLGLVAAAISAWGRRSRGRGDAEG